MSQATATALNTDSLAPLATVYRVVQAPPSAPGFPAIVGKMISYFDGKRDLPTVCDALQLSEARGRAIVKKLTSLGIIETVADTQNGTKLSGSRPEPGFTPEEEAFFASEVEPIDECDLPFESLGEKINLFVSDLILRLKGSPVLG